MDMNDRFDFENRLHQLPTGSGQLATYWAEYTGYANDPTGYLYWERIKIEREFAHSYLEMTGGTFTSGVLG